MSQRDELRSELRDVARRTRAWLLWLADSGADGVVPGQRRQPAEHAPALEPRTQPTAAAGQLVTAGTSRSAAAPKQRKSAAAEERTAAAAAPTEPDTAPPASQQERQQRLAELAERVARCTRCPLHAHRKQTVFGRGSSEAELCFVGEGPGAQEDAQGIPFVGPAGELLDKMIGAMGFDRDEVYVCNIVKCRPPRNRKPTVDEMQACEPYLREQLALVAPEVLVAMGATAVQGLLAWYDAGPHGPGITRLRGNWKVYRGRTPLMPTFHPAYLLRSPEKKRDVWNDLQAVMRRLGREPPPPKRRRR